MAGYSTPGLPALLISGMTGAEQVAVDTETAGGVSPQSAAVPSGATGLGLGVQTVAAFGASQGTATQIPAGAAVVFVTATASTEGVKLPVASTGARYLLQASATVGAKVYAATLGRIGAATTATTAFGPILKGTSALFIGVNSTTWAAIKSA